MGLLIAAILGAASGFGIAWLVIRKLPQDKIREINYQRLQEEKDLFDQQQQEFEQRRRKCEQEMIELDIKRSLHQTDCEQQIIANNKLIEETRREVNALQIQRNEISYSLEQSKKEAEIAAKTFLDQQMALAVEQLDHSLEQIALKYQQDESECQQYYLAAMQEYVAQFQKDISIITKSREALQIELDKLQHNVRVAVEAAKREEAKKSETNFYRLTLPESDLYEIAQLRAVEPYLRDKEALNKVIWKVYYEKPYTDLIGRVLGTNVKTGIYKITCLKNQKCYVGQAVNVADRWKQHIKRGLGAEAPTRNKLYPAMLEYGVENFTFELLDECSKDQLDAQEDYWQDYFKAKEFGYSIK